MSPKRVMKGTGSVGATLLFWLAGVVYCLCGTHVYIEYGLNVPRYRVQGVEQSIPRSGKNNCSFRPRINANRSP